MQYPSIWAACGCQLVWPLLMRTNSHTFPDHHSLKFSKRPEDKVKLPLPKVLMVVYLVAISSKGQGR